jgi:outer membrane protein OmpA-like peptidoglycan-associated protein
MCSCNCAKSYGLRLLPELESVLYEDNSYFAAGREYETGQPIKKSPRNTGTKTTVLPSTGSIVSPTACITSFVNLIPRHLDPKLMACLNKTIPTINTEVLFRKTLGANPGTIWIKKLNTDLRTFVTYLYPKVNLTVELWRFITIPAGSQRSALVPLSTYLKAKSGEFTISIFAPLTSQKTVEKIYGEPLDKFVASAGPLTSQNHSYYWHVYATFPDDVKNNFRQIEWNNVDKFPFNKYELSDIQKKTIRMIAIDVVESWVSQSPKRYTKIILEGHTDIRGTEAYNINLGEKRAKEAAKFLKEEIFKTAPKYHLDPSKMVIQYEIKSHGETRPVSKTPPIVHEFNRRVEITLQAINITPDETLNIDEVIIRSLSILNTKKASMNQDYFKRIHCVLTTMKNPQADDRYITGQVALNVFNSNKFPNKDDWSRLRFFLTNSSFFSKQRPPDKIFESLITIDNMISGGVDEISQKVNSHTAVMYLPLPKEFNALVHWVSKQAKDKNSIYSCGY